MNNNKKYLGYEQIVISLSQNSDLSEKLDQAGYDFEGTYTKTVYVIDKGIYKFPVILFGNRVFYGDDIISQYYQDIAVNKTPEEINSRISSYAANHLSSAQEVKRTKM